MTKNDGVLALDEINNNLYPDLGARFGALIIDAIVLFALVIPIDFLANYGKNIHIYSRLLNLAILLLYNVFFVKKYGGTPGKIISGMKIIKLNTQPITYREAFLRYSVQLIRGILTIGLTIYAISMADNAHYINLGWSKQSGYLSSFYPDLIQIKIFGKMFMQIHWVTQLFGFWTIAETITVLTNPRRRAIHDFIAGTVVVGIGYPGNIHQPVTETEQ